MGTGLPGRMVPAGAPLRQPSPHQHRHLSEDALGPEGWEIVLSEREKALLNLKIYVQQEEYFYKNKG